MSTRQKTTAQISAEFERDTAAERLEQVFWATRPMREHGDPHSYREAISRYHHAKKAFEAADAACRAIYSEQWDAHQAALAV